MECNLRRATSAAQPPPRNLRRATSAAQPPPRNLRRATSAALLILAVNLTGRFVPLHAAPLETEPRLADIGVNHRTWERIVTETRPDGTPFTRRSAYQETGTGLNYFDPATQTWQPTREEWQAGADDLSALFGPHTATVKNNLNRADAVTLVTPDGVRLVSQPVSIGLYDPVDGHQIVLAELVDCAPAQTAPNVIIFRNCFDRINASIRYTYRKAGLSQDLILEEPIALPAGFSDRSRLEFYTAFAPGTPAPAVQTRVLRAETDPAVRAVMLEPDFTDATLFYGEIMRIGPGQAFSLGQAGDDTRLPVGKTITQVNGILVLVEAVEFKRLEPLLAQLAANNPPPGRNANLAINRTRRLRRSADQAAAPPPARSADGPSASPQSVGIQSGSRRRESAPSSATVANAPAHAGGDEGRGEGGTIPSLLRADKLSAPPRQGVVIDYEILSSSSLLLKGDTTYLISSPVVVSNLTIEAGAVVKYTNNASIEVQIGGTISCQTTHYRPAIFTAVNDQTVGEPIGTNTALNGYFASTALILHDANHLLQHLRISHAQTAISLDDGDVTLRHSQFEHCQTALAISYAATYWDNVLFHSVSNVVSGDHLAARGQQVTVDECATFAADANTNGSVGLTNTLLARMTNWGNSSFSTNAVVVTNSAGVFQTLGAGAHYLANGSPYRGTGVTNITADLLLELRQRTTWPPLLLTNTISGSTNMYPAVARITNAPDIGFAYPAVDYAAKNFTLTNGTLTIAPGTVLAGFGATTIWLQDNAQLVCEGTPLQRCHFVPFYAVQEQSTNWGGTAPAAMLGVYPYNWLNAAPSARFRFTDFDSLSGGGYPIYTGSGHYNMASLSLQDCSFNSVLLPFTGDSTCALALTNNLFERTGVSFLYGPTITAYNNLFRGGVECYFEHSGTNTWTFRDNIFYQTTITDFGDPLTHDHNAYLSTVDQLYPTNASDWVLASFTFQTGPLGHYYQGSTNLVDRGSRNATNAGLYHYTTLTNKEASSTIDIGLHYIALSNGVPFDTDGDLLADYFEDANGNSSREGAESSFILADTDTDGLNDAEEYSLGTDPNATNIFSLRITDETNSPLATPVTGRVVGIRVDVNAQTVLDGSTNAIANLTNQWTVGGQRIRSYYHDVDETTNGPDHEHREIPLEGSGLTSNSVSFFWTDTSNSIPVTLQITKGYFTRQTNVYFTNVFQSVDPSRYIYAWLPSLSISQFIGQVVNNGGNINDLDGADPRKSPDGMQRTNKVLKSHVNWHTKTGVNGQPGTLMADGEYPVPFELVGTNYLDPTGGENFWGDIGLPGTAISQTNYNGSAFLVWHRSFLDAHIAWRTTFNIWTIPVTNFAPIPLGSKNEYSLTNSHIALPEFLQRNPANVPPASPPAHDTNFLSLSPTYSYVRLGEYQNLDELGRGVSFVWHVLGHSALHAIDNADPPVMASLASPAASDDLFWRWHTMIDVPRFNWMQDGTDLAMITNRFPENGATISGGITNVFVTFDKKVSSGRINSGEPYTPHVTNINLIQLKAYYLKVNGSQATELWEADGINSTRKAFEFRGFTPPSTGTVTIELQGTASFETNTWTFTRSN